MSTAPLLVTKFYIPAVRSGLVSRPRLIERLDQGIHSTNLTLISAPAGFGKTTLLSEWIHSRMESQRTRFAWLSLDAGDQDLNRFWIYVIAALQTVYADVGHSVLNALRAPQSRSLPIQLLLTELTNEIAAQSGPWVLILDDFHLIDATQIHEGVVFLLDHLPDQGLHIVLSSRTDPPWPLARRRAGGEMTELRASDLRFTLTEVAAFLNDVAGLDLSAEDIDALDARTEGWIAGLQLAALSMQGSRDIPSFVNAFSGSHRLILDYLVEEVLDRQPVAVQSFLLQTSILERMTAPLCDAVMTRQLADEPQADEPLEAQSTLEYLEQANLFVVPLDNDRRWYRYHHLFAELLRGRLCQGQPDLVSVLHRRASRWYETQGLIDEAIGHALQAGDVERAGDLVERNGLQMVVRSECSTLAKWIDRLSEASIRQRPWLCVCDAWARYYVGPREQVEARLQDAEQALERIADVETSIASEVEGRYVAGHIAALRAYMALQDEDLGRVAELAQRALDLLPNTRDPAMQAVQQSSHTLSDVNYARATSAIALAETPRERGDLVASERAYARAREIAEECGNIPMAVSAVAYMAYQQAKQGHLQQALETNRQALELAIQPGGQELPAAGLPYVKMGDLMREWNELGTAAEHLERGIELCLQWGHADALITGYTTLARVQLARGEIAQATDTFGHAEQLRLKTDVDPWATCWVDDCRLRLWLATGNLSAAAAWAKASGLEVDGTLSFVHDLDHVNLARVLVAQGLHRPDGPFLSKALALLARLSEAAEGAGWVGRAIEILVLRSIALSALGDEDDALRALARALALAEPEGYIRVFVDEAPVRRLLVSAIAHGAVPHLEYAGRLLSVFGVAPGEQVVADEGFSALVEPLTERELQVLRLMSANLTSPQMAEELVVSVNTVRTHVQHIYQKLAVHSRYEAVARARELNIV